MYQAGKPTVYKSRTKNTFFQNVLGLKFKLLTSKEHWSVSCFSNLSLQVCGWTSTVFWQELSLWWAISSTDSHRVRSLTPQQYYFSKCFFDVHNVVLSVRWSSLPSGDWLYGFNISWCCASDCFIINLLCHRKYNFVWYCVSSFISLVRCSPPSSDKMAHPSLLHTHWYVIMPGGWTLNPIALFRLHIFIWATD